MARTVYTKNRYNRKRYWQNPKILLPLIAFLILGVAALVYSLGIKTQENTAPRSSNTSNSSSPGPSFNEDQYSVNDPASIWAVVNKGRVLPSAYVPSGLTVPAVPLRLSGGAQEMHLAKEAASALEVMNSAANAQNIHLMLASGYRSYSTQVAVYGAEVKNYGLTQADRESARPGHSEHQSGLSADLEPANRACEISQCFATTPEGKWLAENAYKYGFIIRYQKDKENITGYEYEPWHVRYVSTGLAAQLYKSGQTLE
jgi:D-alanyl-D-alanine carboxypeptidase